MALVADDCLIPTRDAPELGYVKESTNEQYVPDVFYKVWLVCTPVPVICYIVLFCMLLGGPAVPFPCDFCFLFLAPTVLPESFLDSFTITLLNTRDAVFI